MMPCIELYHSRKTIKGASVNRSTVSFRVHSVRHSRQIGPQNDEHKLYKDVLETFLFVDFWNT